MKSLVEFLKSNRDLSEIEKIFLLECELLNISYPNYSINEKYGLYDGEIEFVEVLTQNIINMLKDENNSFDTLTLYKNDLEDFKGIFFKKLILIFDDKVNEPFYTASDSPNNWDSKNVLFNKVEIFLPRKNLDFKKLFRFLTHELLHAWHDYKSMFSKNSKSLLEISKLRKNVALKMLKKLDKSLYSDLAKNISYLFSDHERSAYMGEILGELERVKNVDSYKKALDILKNSSIYKDIKTLYERFLVLDELSDDNEYKEMFILTYNLINKHNYSWNKIFKRVNNDFNKLFTKLIQNCAKIFCDKQVSENRYLQLVPEEEYFPNVKVLNFVKN